MTSWRWKAFVQLLGRSIKLLDLKSKRRSPEFHIGGETRSKRSLLHEKCALWNVTNKHAFFQIKSSPNVLTLMTLTVCFMIFIILNLIKFFSLLLVYNITLRLVQHREKLNWGIVSSGVTLTIWLWKDVSFLAEKLTFTQHQTYPLPPPPPQIYFIPRRIMWKQESILCMYDHAVKLTIGSSFLSALQTSQVLHISMNAQLTYEPIVL